MTNLAIPNWSFSKLQIYEDCPFRFKLGYMDKLPELPRPPDNPLERGNRIHDLYERFVKGDKVRLDLCEAKAQKHFTPLLEHARDLYASGMASAEENWLFDADWNVCSREDVWLWAKLDLNVHDEEKATTIVVDYKSGKSQYKAIAHLQQIQLYAAIAVLRQAWAETIHVELWYVDEGHVMERTFTREQALRFVGRFDHRAKQIYADQHFRPNANRVTCRYCPFSPRGTGACPVGV